MGDFTDEVSLRNEIEKKHPRKASEWLLDVASLASLVVWAFSPFTGAFKLLGFAVIFVWAASRFKAYKKYDAMVKKKVQEKLDEKLDKK